MIRIERKRKIIIRLTMVVFVSIIIGSLPLLSLAKESTDTIKYTIREGDTYYLLSIRFNTTIDSIANMNKGVNPYNLLIGQKINIPVGEGIIAHTVVKGDTLWKIADKYDNTIDTIAAQNYIKDRNLIYTGDVLAIPRDKRVIWLSGEWKGFGYSGEVSQADYDGAYALYNSMSEEKLDELIKEINNSLPKVPVGVDDEGNALPEVTTNPSAELRVDGKGQWNLSIYHVSTRMGNYTWVIEFNGTLNTNKEGFTNGIPVDVEKFAKALYVYKLKASV